MRRWVIGLLTCGSLCWSGLADDQTNRFQIVRQGLAVLKEQAGRYYPEEGNEELFTLEDGILKDPCYATFASLVTNDWRYVVTNINQITTNYIDRLVIFGTGKQGDENLYLAYLETLARMRLDNQITERDFFNFESSTIVSFHTVLWRRYQEPAVSNLIEKTLKIVYPNTNYWRKVQSGEQYRMHLEMTTPRRPQ